MNELTDILNALADSPIALGIAMMLFASLMIGITEMRKRRNEDD